jgi:hypothetical protein
MTTLRTSLPLFVILLITYSGKCTAFETWGFKSGSSKEYVESTARSANEVVDNHGDVSVINRFDPKTQNYAAFFLQFCNDRLFEVSIAHDLNEPEFFDSVYDLMKLHGSPKLSVNDSRITDDNYSRQVTYTWETPGDKVILIPNSSSRPGHNSPPALMEGNVDSKQCANIANKSL